MFGLGRDSPEATSAVADGERGTEQTRRLHPVREFVTAGGDWSAFTWHFEAAYYSVNWTEEEALRALLMVLDDDALTVLYAEMAEVYEPPSDTRNKFLQRRPGEAEMSHAYHRALLALTEAAYPAVDPKSLDSLTWRGPAAAKGLEAPRGGGSPAAEDHTNLLPLRPAGELCAGMPELTSGSNDVSGAPGSVDGSIPAPMGESRHIRHPTHFANSGI
ncbi:unnamed protein product [Lampetra fluviatilis]